MKQTCPNDGCELRLLRRDLEEHMAKDCKFKKIPCQYCGIRLSNELLNVREYIYHFANEQMFLVQYNVLFFINVIGTS